MDRGDPTASSCTKHKSGHSWRRKAVLEEHAKDDSKLMPPAVAPALVHAGDLAVNSSHAVERTKVELLRLAAKPTLLRVRVRMGSMADVAQ
jgi:hypothetical protein